MIFTIHSYNWPSIVLCIEQEVGADDGDADSDYSQNDQHQEHEAIHVVDLVRPERREDEVPAKLHQSRKSWETGLTETKLLSQSTTLWWI